MRMLIIVATVLLLSPSVVAAAGEPNFQQIRRGLQRAGAPSRFIVTKWPSGAVRRGPAHQAQAARPERDSVWNGLLIGAAAGAGGGYVWANKICGRNDSECFAIAGPVGILAGAGIGAAIGAVADALHK